MALFRFLIRIAGHALRRWGATGWPISLLWLLHYAVWHKVPPFGDGPWYLHATATDGKRICLGPGKLPKNFCYGTISFKINWSPQFSVTLSPSSSATRDPNLNAEPAPGYSGNEQICFDNLSDNWWVRASTRMLNPMILILAICLPELLFRMSIAESADRTCLATRPKYTSHSSWWNNGWPVLNIRMCTELYLILMSCLMTKAVISNNDRFNLNVNGASTQCLVSPGVSDATILAVFDGSSASGIWTVTITDDSDGDAGLIEIVCLDILVDVPQSIAFDNCSGLPVLNYVDTENAEIAWADL